MTAEQRRTEAGSDTPDGPESGCLHKVRTALPHLTGARRQVAEVVLSDPWSVRGVSILALARQAGVSENAVTRFTHAVGYSGYREFTQALALDLGKSLGVYHVHPVEQVMAAQAGGEGPLDLVRRVVSLEIESLQDTLTSLSEPVLRHVITQLATARQILLIGTGTAAPLCHLLSYRLASIGAAASWTSDPMMMLAQAARFGSDDVVLAISYSGRSRDTVQALEFARRRGAETIALTAHPRAPIGDVAASVLTIFSQAVPEVTAQFSARIAGMSLLEAIATAVAMEREGGPSPLLHDLGEAQNALNDLPPDWRPSR
jgi:RpiR family carbohydrate utilization transcriptional regulator